MQSTELEEFKLDLLYTLSEVGMHFEIYRQYSNIEYFVLSGILLYSMGRQAEEITFKIHLLANFVTIILGDRSSISAVNAGELVNNVYNLLI